MKQLANDYDGRVYDNVCNWECIRVWYLNGGIGTPTLSEQ